MNYKNTTQVPNELFDIYLPSLTKSELKVLLIIIRQTIGWIDTRTKKRKRKDRISLSFFSIKSGLKRKSISIAIASLIKKDLILALDYNEKELREPKDRKGKKRIYYTCKFYYSARKEQTSVEKDKNIGTYRPITKLRPTKLIPTKPKKLSDKERLAQILQNLEKQNKKGS